MSPNTLVSILKMLLVAEPAAVQLVHDFLVGTGGQSDADVLTSDLADWQTLLAKAKAQIGQ